MKSSPSNDLLSPVSGLDQLYIGAANRASHGKFLGLATVSLLFALLVLSVSCRTDEAKGSADSPDATVRLFYKAILGNDLETFTSLQSSAMTQDMRNALLRAFSQWQTGTSEAKDQIRVEQTSVHETSLERVEVSVTFRRGSPDVLTLMKEGGSWRVVTVATQ